MYAVTSVGSSRARGCAGSHYPFLTSKERDTETGLDYFLARYYSSIQGRFTSVDPDQEGAQESDPQSWNSYAYTGGNPVTRTDPDGKKYLVCDPNGKNCKEVGDEDFYADRRNDTQNGFTYTGSRDFFENGQIKNSDGNVVNTYVQISIDTNTPAGEQRAKIFELRRRTAPIPAATAAFFGISLVTGVTGGTVAYALGPSAITTLSIGGAANAPSYVRRVLSHIKSSNGSPPPGYRGGRTFKNDSRGGGQSLPKTDGNGKQITYREYDVHPQQQGVNRGAERIVRGSDGSTYYTNDHYKTFTKIE